MKRKFFKLSLLLSIMLIGMLAGCSMEGTQTGELDVAPDGLTPARGIYASDRAIAGGLLIDTCNLRCRWYSNNIVVDGYYSLLVEYAQMTAPWLSLQWEVIYYNGYYFFRNINYRLDQTYDYYLACDDNGEGDLGLFLYTVPKNTNVSDARLQWYFQYITTDNEWPYDNFYQMKNRAFKYLPSWAVNTESQIGVPQYYNAPTYWYSAQWDIHWSTDD
ncbi:MAG: hypothetical protein EHM28_02320 [Spirochaetaceae bacterium]|nr:MAG: hypothetical protein EHM28_02320 [Spirochaetaceae bacterium]